MIDDEPTYQRQTVSWNSPPAEDAPVFAFPRVDSLDIREMRIRGGPSIQFRARRWWQIWRSRAPRI